MEMLQQVVGDSSPVFQFVAGTGLLAILKGAVVIDDIGLADGYAILKGHRGKRALNLGNEEPGFCFNRVQRWDALMLPQGTTERAARAYFFLKSFFKFARPLTAMSLRLGSILRQMAAARAMTFTSVVKLSMTTSPV